MRVFVNNGNARRPARTRTLRGFRDQTVARMLVLAAMLVACLAFPAKAAPAPSPDAPPALAQKGDAHH